MATRKKTVVEEIRTAFMQYLDVYFSQRDFAATQNMFSPNISCIGTGWDELAFNPQDTISLFLRDFAGAPNTVTFTLDDLHVVGLSDVSGLASAQMEISTIIQGQSIRFSRLRKTVIFKKIDDAWLIEFMHVSLPTAEHGSDEAYPVKELEDRMVVITRLVDEKTCELSAALDENKRLAATDKLTGAFNRRFVEENLLAELQRSERYGDLFSVILLDIDHFKKVNDRHGHIAGDKFLSEFARVVGGRLRSTDILGRWGGEEFLVLSPKTTIDEIALLSEMLRRVVESHEFGLPETITFSAGISTCAAGDTPETLLQRADKALYKAKRRGRNRVCR